MAKTTIPVELSSTPGITDNSNATAITIDSSEAVTFTGDVQAPGLYVGSTNTSYDFYNNGTSYLNGNVTIDADLTLTSSGGIFLGGTGSANKLTDYEEGTWTPTFQGATLSTAVGHYTKIGNQVTVHYTVVTTGGLPSSGTQVQVGGLPFAQNSGNLSAGSVYCRYYTPNDSALTIIVQDGESVIRYININDQSFDYTLMGELEASANNSIYTIGTITYIV